VARTAGPAPSIGLAPSAAGTRVVPLASCETGGALRLETCVRCRAGTHGGQDALGCMCPKGVRRSGADLGDRLARRERPLGSVPRGRRSGRAGRLTKRAVPWSMDAWPLSANATGQLLSGVPTARCEPARPTLLGCCPSGHRSSAYALGRAAGSGSVVSACSMAGRRPRSRRSGSGAFRLGRVSDLSLSVGRG
jgi:hypothetical protein